MSVWAAALVFVGVVGEAAAQMSYVSRESLIGYFEQDFDPTAVPPFSEPITFRAEDVVGTSTGELFAESLVFPEGRPLYQDTTAEQVSQLFTDAIEFIGRAYAEEDVSDNLFGTYTAGAVSQMNVVFDLAESIDFTLTSLAFDASRSDRPGTTRLSLVGPSVDIDVTSGPVDFSGTLEPGRYTFNALIESLGFWEDTFQGVERSRGEEIGFDALLLLGSAASGLAGDFNGNGAVEQWDLDLVLGNWGSPTTPAGFLANTAGLTDGVDQDELDAVLGNWGSSATPAFAGSAVPEPGLAAAALLGLAGLGRRRR